MSITRINEFQAAEGKADELFEFLKSLVPYISSSEGCMACQVLTNNDEQHKFIVIEEWQSIEYHKLSIEKFPKEKMQAAMTLFGSAPKGGYYH